MKTKLRYNYIGHILLLILAVVCIFLAVKGSNQAALSLPLQQEFTGEYSYDGENWYDLDSISELSALEGDITLRGHLSFDCTEGTLISYYRDHIGVTMYVNGEQVYIDALSEVSRLGYDLMPSMCGKEWSGIISPGITTEDEIEFKLHNPHKYGNKAAYEEFLHTLYNTGRSFYILEEYMKPYSVPFQAAGLISIVAALLILGAAITAGVLRIDEVRCFWKVGCMAFFLGGFLLLDTINTSFRSELLVFNTYGRQLCLMLMVYCMEFYVVGTFKGAVGKTAEKFMLLSAVFDCVLIVVSMAGKMIIYDTGMYWKASQMVICPVLILCCIIDMRKKGKGKKLIEAFYIVMLLSVPADVFGVCDCIYSHENCTKAMLLMFLTGYIALSIKRIVKDYEAALRASRLEKELEENRIAVMLSQIQPHFLYNVLVCIRKLCETDAKQAQAALDDFSAYLRGNMDSLKSRELIPFSQELKHIETYLNLEKLRFGDELQVEYDLQTEDFEIPSLSIQPIVENAAKHGVGQKSGGGTVTLRTRKEGEKITIVVEDNGVGFDINNPVNDGRSHIGIQNVRERLRKMADAELDIQSTPGKGTKVTVVMEKSQKER